MLPPCGNDPSFLLFKLQQHPVNVSIQFVPHDVPSRCPAPSRNATEPCALRLAAESKIRLDQKRVSSQLAVPRKEI